MSSESDQPAPPVRARESAPDPPRSKARSPESAAEPSPSGQAPSGTAPGTVDPAPDLPNTLSERAPEGSVTDVTDRPASGPVSPEQVREHLRRRAIFLRELAEARELRRRVTPHRSRRARIHAALRRRTFRID